MLATISYRSEEHGELDVDYKFRKFAELDDIVTNGPGMTAILGIKIEPPQYSVDSLTPNATIEALVRRLDVIDQIKNDSIDGAEQQLARSSHVQPHAEKHTSVQTVPKVKAPQPEKPVNHESLATRWLELFTGPASEPLMGAG